jgi:hypothetical protein
MTRPTFCRCGLQLVASGHCPDEHAITHHCERSSHTKHARCKAAQPVICI